MHVSLPDGGRLAYEVAGHGDPILLVRPLGGSLVSWDRFSRALAEHLRVVCFDPRGAGGSSAPPMWWTTKAMARDAVALLDALDLARCHVYGLSMGGMAASWLAILAPERVDRLVLASTLPYGLELRTRGLARAASLALCLGKPGAELDACMATRVLSDRFRSRSPEAVERIRMLARQRPSTRTNVLKLLAAVARHDARRSLRRIRAPTLLMAGDLDELPTLGSRRELLHGIPDVALHVMRDVGHDLSAEAPERAATVVLDFVRGRG